MLSKKYKSKKENLPITVRYKESLTWVRITQDQDVWVGCDLSCKVNTSINAIIDPLDQIRTKPNLVICIDVKCAIINTVEQYRNNDIRRKRFKKKDNKFSLRYGDVEQPSGNSDRGSLRCRSRAQNRKWKKLSEWTW